MVCEKISFDEACHKICRDLNLDYKLFIDYINEDTIGGYPDKWPSGSIWGVEGQILYALTRILKPNTIIEIGTSIGCSTEHFLRALDMNSKGRIYTIDIAENEIFIETENENLLNERDLTEIIDAMKSKGYTAGGKRRVMGVQVEKGNIEECLEDALKILEVKKIG